MSDCLVSILIPVFNRYELAVNAIDSALNQELDKFEIIIGDNCSTDGTYEKLNKKYFGNKKIRIFQNSRNLGPVNNWIECLKRAKGDYVKFLWSDDLMSADCISKSLVAFEQYPNAAFVYSSVCLFNGLGGLSDVIKRKNKIIYVDKPGEHSGEEFIKKVCSEVYNMPVSPGCAMFKREKLKIQTVVNSVKLYDHKSNGAGVDLLMFLNALSSNETYVHISESLNYFREHKESISSYDKTILIGYWTAKLAYLKESKYYNYTKYVNDEIIAENLKQIIQRKIDANVLLESFYEKNDRKNIKFSYFRAVIWKIKRKIRYV